MNVNEIRNPAAQLAALHQVQKKQGREFEQQLKSVADTAPVSSQSPQASPAGLTDSEKSYFEELYPSASGEVRGYNPYTSAGTTASVRLGSLVDRRG